MRPTTGEKGPDIFLEGKALSEHDASGVRSLLAFASVKCSAMNHLTLDSALLALLYALDFQLAEVEFARTAKAT